MDTATLANLAANGITPDLTATRMAANLAANGVFPLGTPPQPGPGSNRDNRPLADKLELLRKREGLRAAETAKRLEQWLWRNAQFMDSKAMTTFQGLDPRGQKRVIDNIPSLAQAWDPTSYIYSWAKDPAADNRKRKKSQGSLTWTLSHLPDAREAPPQMFYCTVAQENEIALNGFPLSATCVVHRLGLEIFKSADEILQEVLGEKEVEDCVYIEDDPEWKRYPEIAQAVNQSTGGVEERFAIAICPILQKWAVGCGGDIRKRHESAKLALALCVAFERTEIAERLCTGFDSFGGVWKQLVQGTALDPEAVQAAMDKTPMVHLLQLDPSDQLARAGMQVDGYAIVYNKTQRELFSYASWIQQHLVDNKACDYTDDPDWSLFPGVGQALKNVGLDGECYAVATCRAKRCWAVGVGNSSKTRQQAAKLSLCLVMAQKDHKLVEVCDRCEEFYQFVSACQLFTPQQAESLAKRRKAKEDMNAG